MFRNLPKQVRLVEVAARDGLQNERQPVSTADKFAFIRKLVDAGHTYIELTSFVRPEAIPQLADATELVQMVNDAGFADDIHFSCLVPNMRGLEKALSLGVKEIAIFLATSDSFSQKNINASVADSFTRVAPVVETALKEGVKVRGYLSTVFGCPYEGNVPVQKVLSLSTQMLDMGCYEVSLGDTIGIATPPQVQEILSALAIIPNDRLALHFHDTRGMALANVLTGLEMGITTFDGSAGGIGGCPYAKGASGNVSMEELVYLFRSFDIRIGIDLVKLADASRFMLNILGKESPSKLQRIL